MLSVNRKFIFTIILCVFYLLLKHFRHYDIIQVCYYLENRLPRSGRPYMDAYIHHLYAATTIILCGSTGVLLMFTLLRRNRYATAGIRRDVS